MDPDRYHRLTAGANDAGKRLDNLLKHLLPGLSVGDLHKALRQGDIRLDDRRADAADRVAAGQVLRVFGPLWQRGQTPTAAPNRPPAVVLSPGQLDAITVFRNDHLWAINKPAGLPTNGPGSVDEAVKAALRPLLPPSLTFRPGSLHQLDQGTSGLLWFSVSLDGARTFSGWLQAGLLVKRYLALLTGSLGPAVVWQDRLVRDQTSRTTAAGPEGQLALTQVTPLLQAEGLTLALCTISTGRTHQIRAQAALAGHPLWGDRKYGAAGRPGGFLLHAWQVNLPLNSWGLDQVEAPLPADFQAELQRRFGLTDVAGLKNLGEFGTDPNYIL